MSHQCKVSAFTAAPLVGWWWYNTFIHKICFMSSDSCVITPSGFRCLCAAGFEGNGTFCQGENTLMVQVNHTYSCFFSPVHACVCLSVAQDPCVQNNGGCCANAVCKRTLPGRRDCVCHTGFSGDGIVCIGTSTIFIFHLLHNSFSGLNPVES